MRRVLFVSYANYLDDSNGAAVASRSMMQALARLGFAAEVLCGPVLNLRQGADAGAWLSERHPKFEEVGGEAWTADMRGVRADVPPHCRLSVGGVPIVLYRGTTTRPHRPDDAGRLDFLRLLAAALDRFRPDVLAGYGGDRLAFEVFREAKARGVATAFALHNFAYPNRTPFADADAVLVPSHFAAEHYRQALGLDCQVLPNLIDRDRIRVERPEPKYLTFVNPSREKGVYAFARIADELGRRRPDIPVLVVEGRGTEADVAACGLDLRRHGTVFFLAHTHDPRKFWRRTQLCLMPSLWWENQPLVAIEAMTNGLPVIGSDRGGLPECLGDAGVVLPLPERLTPATRLLPTADEVAPWVEAITRLWDDADLYAEHRRRALAEARRWDPEVLEPEYVRFFEGLRP